MHSLQKYRRDSPIYDGNAYTISCTHQDGQLKMYAHHPTKPTTPGGQPEYHMTQLGAYAMTHSRDTCVEGLEAFRNGSEWAKEQRDRFIETANVRAPGGAWRCHLPKETTERRCNKMRVRVLQKLWIVTSPLNRETSTACYFSQSTMTTTLHPRKEMTDLLFPGIYIQRTMRKTVKDLHRLLASEKHQ